MSYPAEDRHERDVVSGPARNPAQEMEKHDKSKVPMTGPESGSFHRPQVDQGSLKMGKPLQNRPIAPASGGLAGMIPGGHLAPGLVASSMQGFGAGHPLLASMMRMPQPAFSHVPAGAAAGAALAGVTPRNTSLRTPSVPPSVKPLGLSTQPHVSGGQSQTHTPATTTGSSRPSSPGPTALHVATVAVPSSMHQPGSEHKPSEMRDARPAMMSDLARRGASSTVQSVGAAHTPVSVGGKVINIVPSAPLPQNLPVQKSSVPTLPSHHPSSVHSSIPVSAVGVSSVSSSLPHLPSPGTIMAGHSQPSKMMPSNTVSVAPAILTTAAKLYTPPHHLAFTAPRPAPISSADTSMNPADHSRLGKPSGTASPASVSSHHTSSTISAGQHMVAPSLNSVVGNEGRMDRAHQALPQFPYHPGMAGMAGMAGLFYQDALSAVHPGLHAQYHQPAFGPMQSLARTQQGVATSAAAAAAAQVAAAAGVNPMQIMDHPRLIFQPTAAALGVGASGIANLTGTDTPATAGIMDITGANLYSVPIFNVPPSTGMQATQLSAPNPNATSPRPSILRKRASDGLRKPTSQLPFTAEMLASSQTDAAASPRSDSTLSAPHSTQNSPKPASESGSQSESAVTTASVTTTEPPVVTQTAPVSPTKIKREPSSEAAPTSSVVTTAVMNGSVTSAPATSLLSNVTTANTDAASPRKKPRKQNVVATEDKYGSNVNMEPDSPTDEDKNPKPEEADEDLKFILMKRPRISIVANYKINTKAAHNHFQRYSDVKAKEERKPSIQEIASQKGIVQRANGWRIQHIAGQIDELISAEQDVLKKMGEFRERIPKAKPGQKTKFQDELVMLNELLQGNIQRSQLVVEQLGDSRKSMVKVLEHRQRVMEIIQKQMNKRNPKKKNQ